MTRTYLLVIKAAALRTPPLLTQFKEHASGEERPGRFKDPYQW
ncbi:hypothetical protein [Streptomyces sp. NPDC015125]